MLLPGPLVYGDGSCSFHKGTFFPIDGYQIVFGGLQVSHILFGHFANVIPHCILACMVSENWGVILIFVPL